MKFPQVFGSFPSFFKSPFSARKRKRDQTEATDLQSLRPSKLPHSLPTETTALVSPPSLQPVPSTFASRSVLPQARKSHLAQSGGAELTQPVTDWLQHSAARTSPDTSQSQGLYRPQLVNAQPAATVLGLHRNQQHVGAQLSAKIPYDQLTRQPDQVYSDVKHDPLQQVTHWTSSPITVARCTIAMRSML